MNQISGLRSDSFDRSHASECEAELAISALLDRRDLNRAAARSLFERIVWMLHRFAVAAVAQASRRAAAEA